MELWLILSGFLFISLHSVRQWAVPEGLGSSVWIMLHVLEVQIDMGRGSGIHPWVKMSLRGNGESVKWLSPVISVTCKAFNSNLVEVNDATEYVVLVGHLQSLHPHDADKQSTNYWIGGNDIESEHHFVWAGSGADFTYTHWYRGQPDKASDKQDCVLMYGPDNFQWHDISCEFLEQFICETKIENDGIVIG